MKTNNLNRDKKHILVVSQYFYPEQFRINDICQEWIKRGYKVTVVTGIPNYPVGKFYKGYGVCKKRREKWMGIDIIRLPIVARGNNKILLGLNYLSFVVSGFIWKLLTRVKADFVLNYEVSPMTSTLIGVWYANKVKIACYTYITDLWPDCFEIVTGISNKAIINPLNRMTNYVYRKSKYVFVSSNSFLSIIKQRGVKSDKIIFWPQYAEDFYHPINIKTLNETVNELSDSIPQDDIMNFTFAGNIGYAQGLNVLVQAAKIIQKQNVKMRFNIIGDGRYKDTLVAAIKREGVTEYFNLINKQPAEKIPLLLAQSDVALICLDKSKVFAMTIPAKTQSCLACGKPIIVSADGEIQDVIYKANCGYCSDAQDEIGLAKNIIAMTKEPSEKIEEYGNNARNYYEKNYSKELLLEQIDQFFRD